MRPRTHAVRRSPSAAGEAVTCRSVSTPRATVSVCASNDALPASRSRLLAAPSLTTTSAHGGAMSFQEAARHQLQLMVEACLEQTTLTADLQTRGTLQRQRSRQQTEQ